MTLHSADNLRSCSDSPADRLSSIDPRCGRAGDIVGLLGKIR